VTRQVQASARNSNIPGQKSVSGKSAAHNQKDSSRATGKPEVNCCKQAIALIDLFDAG